MSDFSISILKKICNIYVYVSTMCVRAYCVSVCACVCVHLFKLPTLMKVIPDFENMQGDFNDGVNMLVVV